MAGAAAGHHWIRHTAFAKHFMQSLKLSADMCRDGRQLQGPLTCCCSRAASTSSQHQRT